MKQAVQLGLLALVARPWCGAELLRVETHERTDVLNGAPFGAAGPYERIVGRAYFSVDPAAPHNRGIADIDLAPRNQNGRVEFSADVYVLKPRDPAKGNGAVVVEVVNRGGKGMLGRFQRARGSSNDPVTAAQLGDGLLMEQGYTMAWVGWQHDVPPGGGRMRVYVPQLPDTVTGPVRSEFTVSRNGLDRFPLGDSGHIAYPPVDAASIRVTVRDGVNGERTPVSQWRLEGDSIVVPGGLALGRTYEAVYTGTRAAVAGLGLAAMRDFVSFLKHGARQGADVTSLGDQRRFLKRAIGFGSSQSGAMLRAFLYEGFNADEQGRKVFEGVFAHIAGGRRLTFQRFTQPSRTAGPLRDASLSTTDQLPFVDAGGVLDKADKAGVTPKIFYTNSAYEYWGSGGSLIHTTPGGERDVPLPSGTRAYLFSGGQHGPAPFPPSARAGGGGGGARYVPSFNEYTWAMRALLFRLDAWIKDGVEPPASAIPLVANGSLVDRAGYRFPQPVAATAGELPRGPHQAWPLDFGPDYRTKGIVAFEPPRRSDGVAPFGAKVPQADADGNDAAGVRMPAVAVPLGAFTGWNLRGPTVGAASELMANTGSYFAFAWTKADRERNGDTRASVEERYASRQDYLTKVEGAARELVRRGFLLERDVAAQVAAAGAQWDWQSSSGSGATTQQRTSTR